MKRLVPKFLLLLLAVGMGFGWGCCSVPKNPLTGDSSKYICQWSDIQVAQGVSVVVGGNPKGKSIDELAEKGLSFRTKHERVMECQALEPPEELKNADQEFINKSVPSEEPKRSKQQYINIGNEI